MEDLTEKKVSGETKYQGRIVNVRIDEVELPSGNRTYREVVEHPGAVAVLGKTDEGELVLLRQYRYPTGETLLEIPAGKLEPGELPQECAYREMIEETGYQVGKLELLSRIYTTPGFCDEVIYIFRGHDLKFTSAPTGTDGHGEEESLEPVLFSREEALEQIKNGTINDAKTIIAITWP